MSIPSHTLCDPPSSTAVSHHRFEPLKLKQPFWRYFPIFREADHAFLLDSGIAPTKRGRYSFMGGFPIAVFRGDRCLPTSEPFCSNIELYRYKTPAGEPLHEHSNVTYQGDALQELRKLLAQYAVPYLEAARKRFPLLAGGVGYFGYEAGSWTGPGGEIKTDPSSKTPDIYFALYDTVLCHCHHTGQTFLSVVGRGKTKAEALEETSTRSAAIRLRIDQLGELRKPSAEQNGQSIQVETCFNELSYRQAVQQIRSHINAGNIYQACMTQQFRSPLAGGNPWDLYCELRDHNPAPFAGFLQTPEFCVVSASPERYLSVDAKGQAESRPIKGTRPRGATPDADAALRDELAASGKDRAENVMIVDLVRNDFGRVCQFQSIQVAELMAIESYATVFQMVSTIRGQLADGYDALDLVRASFPGGSMTGAPKIEAMKILSQLEPVRRGIYSGAIGYLDFDGLLDLNIVIRSFVIEQGICAYGAGGAVVADSDPRSEYLESLDKIRALQSALSQLKHRGNPIEKGDPAMKRVHPDDHARKRLGSK